MQNLSVHCIIFFFIFLYSAKAQCTKTWNIFRFGGDGTVASINRGGTLQFSYGISLTNSKTGTVVPDNAGDDQFHFAYFAQTSTDGYIIFRVDDVPANSWLGAAVYEDISTTRSRMISFSFPNPRTNNGIRYRTNTTITPLLKNFLFNQPSPALSNVHYYGFGKLERVGGVVFAYYSDDQKTWLFITSYALTSSSQSLYWGFGYGTTTNPTLGLNLNFQNAQAYGLGTSCMCNLGTTGSACSTMASDSVECSLNTWRYSFSVTDFNPTPSLTINTNSLVIKTQLKNVQSSPLVDEETVFAFKEISGNGSITASFNPKSDANLKYSGLQMREVASITSTLTGYNVYQCIIPFTGNIFTNTRVGSLSSNFVSSVSVISQTYYLKITKSGTTYSCDYSSDGIIWNNIETRTIIFTSSLLHIGMISNGDGGLLNIDTPQTFTNIRYTGFQGYCNNNHTACGVKNGAQDSCICKPGYIGTTCETMACGEIAFSDPNVCNRNGTCVAPEVCNCNSRYTGIYCQFPICYGLSANDSSVCRGGGSCISPNNCACNSGYGGLDCYPICFGILGNLTSTCSGHGNCTSPNTCSCSSDWSGNMCQNPICYGIPSNNSTVCSSHGECTSPNNCICTPDYQGPNCQYPLCFGIPSNNSMVCKGNGNCTSPNVCSCKIGYGGNDCIPICNGLFQNDTKVCNFRGNCTQPDQCSCKTNYYGNDCQNYNCSNVINTSPLVCNSQGRCLDYNNCSCNSTYTGDNCQYPICFNIPSNNASVCNQQGRCISPDNCICNSTYTGNKCQYPYCFGIPSNDSRTCSSKGDCLKPDECYCIANRSGYNCEFSTCWGVNSTDPNVCLSRGACIDANNCSCNSNYTGSNCQIPKCYGIPANDPTVCSANGICESLNNCTCKTQNRGKRCESFQYFWKDGINGYWSNISNWLVNIDGIIYNAQRFPIYEDEIFIDKPGTYNVTFDLEEDYKILDIVIGSNTTSNPTLYIRSKKLQVTRSFILNSKGTINFVNTTFTFGESKFFGKIITQSENNSLLGNNLVFQGTTLLDGDLETSLYNNFTFNSTTISKSIIDTSLSSFNFISDVTFNGNSKLLVKSPFVFNNAFNSQDSAILDVLYPVIFNSMVSIKSSLINGTNSITFNGKTIINSNSLSIQIPIIFNDQVTFEIGNYNIESDCQINSRSIINGNLMIKSNGLIKGSVIDGIGAINIIGTLTLNQNEMIVYPKINLEGNMIVLTNINVYNQVDMIKSSLIDLKNGVFNLYNIMNMNTINPISLQGDGTFYIKNNATISRTANNDVSISLKLVIDGLITLSSTKVNTLKSFSVNGKISLDQSTLSIESTSNMILNSNSFIGNGILQVSSNANLNLEAITPLTIPYNFIQRSFVQFKGTFILSSNFEFNSNAQLDVLDNSFVTLKGISNIYPTLNGFTGAGTIITDGVVTYYSGLQMLKSKLIIQSQATFQSGNHYLINTVFEQSSIINLEKDSTIHLTNGDISGKDNIFKGFGKVNIIDKGILKWKGTGSIINEINNFGSIIIEGRLSIMNLNITSSVTSIQGGTLKLFKESKLYWNQGDSNSIEIENEGFVLINGATPKRLNSTIIKNQGNVMFSSYKTTFINSIIINQGVFTQKEGIIDSQSNQNTLGDIIPSYSFINNGEMNIISENNVFFLLPFENFGTMNLKGSGNIELNPKFNLYPFCTVLLSNVTLIVNEKFNFTNGNFYVSGKIKTPIFIYSSNTGVMRTLDFTSSLTIEGNFTFTQTGFLFIQVYDLLHNQIYVTGHSIINGLIYIKLGNGYVPNIGDLIPFLKSPTYSIETGLLNLIGASYRTAKFREIGDSVKFEIIFSFGAAESRQKYKCHYLGNSKILEFVDFKENNGISVTFTTPGLPGNWWIGFGFDLFGNISTSNMIVTSESGKPFEMNNHFYPTTNNSKLLDFGTNFEENIFKIGPKYQSISIFIQKSALSNQSYIYYAHGNENAYSNSTHFYLSPHTYRESFKFSIINDETTDCTNYLAPTRREIYSEGASIFLLIVYALITVLCIVFYRYQPLQSRGISPYFTLGFLFAQLLLEFRNRFYITAFQGSLCFHFAYGIFPLMQVCFIIIFLYFMRYFAIINFNNAKNSASDREIKISMFKIRFLKLLSSSWFTIIILLFSFIMINIIFTIILASDKFICKFSTLTTLKSINNIQLIIIYILTLILLLGDVISNYEITFKKCQWWTFITQKDPYYFRIQIFLFIPFMVYNLITEIIAFAWSIEYIDQILHHLEITIYYTITYTIVLIIDVIFPLMITIFLFFRNLFRKKNNDIIITTLFEIPEVALMFLNFAKKEFSVENVACFQDIQLFKKKKKDPMEIYETYFSGPDALLEVNVPKAHCQDVLAQIQSEKYDSTLFDKLEKTVIINLSDTYSRFIFSKDYEEYQRNNSFKKELIEGHV